MADDNNRLWRNFYGPVSQNDGQCLSLTQLLDQRYIFAYVHVQTNPNTVQIITHIPWLERSVSGVSNSRCICIYTIAVSTTFRKTWQKLRKKKILKENNTKGTLRIHVHLLVKTRHTDSCSKFFLSQQHYLISLQDCFFLCDFMSIVQKATSYGRIWSRLIHSLWIIAESTALLILCLYSCVMVTETFVSDY